jgi:hypothetical protein
MKRVLLGLIFISGTATAAAADPQATAAFRAAFGKSGSAIVKLTGEQMTEQVKFKPGALVQTPFGPALLAPGEVVDAAHVNAGKMGVIYLKKTPRGYAATKRFVPAMETGSFGQIGKWQVSRAFGAMPVVSVEGGGTWQGYTCNWTTLLELAPDKPKELATVPLYYDNTGAIEEGKRATTINGKIARIVPGKSFDVVYSGARKFTEHYVRRGDTYVLAGGGETKMETC